MRENSKEKNIEPVLINNKMYFIDKSLYENLLYDIKSNYIPIQKVKDKIEAYKNILKTCNKSKDIDRIKAINERILELEDLLESEE